MKKLFGNSVFALCLTVITVFATMLLSTRMDFGRKCESVTEGFYTRSDGELSIADSLRNLCTASDQLTQLGIVYNTDDADEMLEITNELRSMLHSSSASVHQIYCQYERLLSALFTLEAELGRSDLNNADKDVFAAARHEAADAKAAVDASSYHTEVSAFLKRYGRFPTSTLASIVGVEMPCTFS